MHQHLQVDPDQVRSVLGEDAANRILNMPGVMPMAEQPPDERPPPGPGHNSGDAPKQEPPGYGDNSGDTPPEPDSEPPKPPPPPLLPPLSATIGVLSGTPAKIRSQDDSETTRGLTRENESARFLADKGYNVEQSPKVPGSKNPDYRINGEVYDNYAPAKNTSVRNVAGRIQNKVTSGQTERVVVNLDDSSITPEQLLGQLTKYPIPGLRSVIAISPKSGAIMHWSFP
ncbi:MAG: hypothetical protein JSR91_11015 [Proteobacteria bacterium]|nr:hypothetical protein [Pseudomonadota bacterium]